MLELFCSAIHRKDWQKVSELIIIHHPEIEPSPYFEGAVEVKFSKTIGAVTVKQSDWKEITKIQNKN